MAKSTKPPTVAGPASEALLRQLLRFAGGTLPGEFLRLQGLDAPELVTRGLLQRQEGRWSNSYVAGPLLHEAERKHGGAA